MKRSMSLIRRNPGAASSELSLERQGKAISHVMVSLQAVAPGPMPRFTHSAGILDSPNPSSAGLPPNGGPTYVYLIPGCSAARLSMAALTLRSR
jgi:hypothetical protein